MGQQYKFYKSGHCVMSARIHIYHAGKLILSINNINLLLNQFRFRTNLLTYEHC